jgi:hypothetical protein
LVHLEDSDKKDEKAMEITISLAAKADSFECGYGLVWREAACLQDWQKIVQCLVSAARSWQKGWLRHRTVPADKAGALWTHASLQGALRNKTRRA